MEITWPGRGVDSKVERSSDAPRRAGAAALDALTEL